MMYQRKHVHVFRLGVNQKNLPDFLHFECHWWVASHITHFMYIYIFMLVPNVLVIMPKYVYVFYTL